MRQVLFEFFLFKKLPSTKQTPAVKDNILAGTLLMALVARSGGQKFVGVGFGPESKDMQGRCASADLNVPDL